MGPLNSFGPTQFADIFVYPVIATLAVLCVCGVVWALAGVIVDARFK